ncbi:hypothetical protein [Candidatus Nitrotoga sp. 1052]|uniref:hypothetical protein n=1 Tax=Candidatus Nitrotoga sp. 1052 TaxID=2886964 RepID=UPI001EF6FE0D|nr:hypothetical protein [Candidatus Nitrotoga sp. 1052]CAH1083769.1 hypothetical protein NTG1052_490007 [Candidatus Nitrotoga sp. 1052]
MSKLTHTTHVTKDANVCDESNQEPVKTGQLLVRQKGKTLSMDLINRVQKQVELRMSALKHGMSYTLRQICGEKFWSQLKKGECIDAGQCMVYMTEQNTLPLTHVKCAHEYPRRYKLK